MPRPARLVLHVGLPKTGSTAWQVWADQNRAALLARGIDYPASPQADTGPNHQILRAALMKGDLAPVARMVEAAQAPVLFLSAEGLSLMLDAFRQVPLRAFRAMLDGIEVTCVLVLRETEGWVTSMHKQAVLNNPNPAQGYATDETRAAFAARPRIRALLDHAALPGAVQAAFGARDCVVLDYARAPFDGLCAVLGLKDAQRFPVPPVVHVSVSGAVVEIVRQVNAMDLPPALRQAFLALVQHSEGTLHRLMLRAAAINPASGLLPDVLLPVLDRLDAPDDQASALVRRLRNRLAHGR